MYKEELGHIVGPRIRTGSSDILVVDRWIGVDEFFAVEKDLVQSETISDLVMN
jgi:hypothetical protein